MLAEVDLSVTDRPQQRAEDPMGRGVVPSEEGPGVPAQVLVDVTGVGVGDATGGRGEREGLGDFVSAAWRRRPPGASPDGAGDQRADDAAVRHLVELEQHFTNQHPKLVDAQARERRVDIVMGAPCRGSAGSSHPTSRARPFPSWAVRIRGGSRNGSTSAPSPPRADRHRRPSV